MSISILMITHNDAERLYIALDKLLQNYDFLTIVDNGSTDETIHLGNYFAMRSAGRVSFFGPEVRGYYQSSEFWLAERGWRLDSRFGL